MEVILYLIQRIQGYALVDILRSGKGSSMNFVLKF